MLRIAQSWVEAVYGRCPCSDFFANGVDRKTVCLKGRSDITGEGEHWRQMKGIKGAHGIAVTPSD